MLSGACQTQPWRGLQGQEPGNDSPGRGSIAVQAQCPRHRRTPHMAVLMLAKSPGGRLSLRESHHRGGQQPLHFGGPGCQKWGFAFCSLLHPPHDQRGIIPNYLLSQFGGSAEETAPVLRAKLCLPVNSVSPRILCASPCLTCLGLTCSE